MTIHSKIRINDASLYHACHEIIFHFMTLRKGHGPNSTELFQHQSVPKHNLYE